MWFFQPDNAKNRERNSGTIIHKSFMVLVYADDIDIIGLNKRAATAAFSSLEKAAADEQSFGMFKSKLLRKIFDPICVDGEYRRRMNHELYDDVELAKR